MIRSGKRWVAVTLAALMSVGGTVTASAATNGDDSAIAGVSVVINNYSASSSTPQDEIYNYLVNQQTTASTESAVAITLNPQDTTAETVKVVSDDATAQGSGLVSVLGEVNVRREPSLDADILGTLASNSKVTVYDTVSNEEGNWYLISSDTVQGYVSASYVVTGIGTEVTVSNVTNQTAEVVTDGLTLYDSASAENEVGTLKAGDTYQVVEIQGGYAKLSNGDYVIGYASIDGLKISTQVLGAQVDDATVAQNFTDYMTDINFGQNEYYKRSSKGEYRSAYDAISYVVELWGYYIDYANDLGYTEVAANAEELRDAAAAQMAEAKAKVPADELNTTAYADNSQVQTTATAATTAATETAAASTEQAVTAAETAAQTPASTEAIAPPSDTTVETPATAASTEAGTEATTASIAPPATLVSIEARYQGGTKYAGDVIYSNELYIHAVYSDGSEADITDGWACANVGMTLAEGNTVITMTYGGLSSSFDFYVNPAPTQATTAAAPATDPAPASPAATDPAATTAVPATDPIPAPTDSTPAPTPATEATTTAAASSASRDSLVSYALSWVGQCNYVWGGTNLVQGGGVDCSGFTMLVYQRATGIGLPHYSGAQAGVGTAVSYEQLRPGDLVIYPGHVAIYIGNGQIVHAKNASVGIVTDSIFFKPGFNPIGYRSLLP